MLKIIIIVLCIITAFAFGEIVGEGLQKDHYTQVWYRRNQLEELKDWLDSMIDDYEDFGRPEPVLWTVRSKIKEMLGEEKCGE